MKKLILSMIAVLLFFTNSFSQVKFEVGDVVPDFTITDVHGKVHKLSEYTLQGKNVILDFFFVTCGNCQVIAPILNSFYHKYGCNQGNIVVLGIDSDDKNAAVINFENTYTGANPYPTCSGFDGGGNDVTEIYDVTMFATVCLIGADGKLKNKAMYISDISSIESACTSAGIILTQMECVIGIESDLQMSSVLIYPNPTSDFITIDTKETLVNVEILDMLGKEIIIQRPKQQNVSIDVSALKEGFYILKLHSKSGEKTYKFGKK